MWWLPSDPEDRWAGSLELGPAKGPRLTVTVQKAYHSLLAGDLPPALYGHDEHGKPITLLFPGRPQSQGAAAITKFNLGCGYVVLGIHVPNRDAFNVNSLTLQLQHLYEWGGISGFPHDEQSTLETIHVRYSQPKEQSFPIDSDLTLELQSPFSFQNGWSEKHLRESLAVTFSSKQGLDFKKCLDLVNALRGLLHFAVLEPVYPLQISATKSDYGTRFDGNFFPHDIAVWNSIIREPVEPETFPERWIFQFKDVQKDFGRFFADWLSYTEKYEEALGCYFTTIYHPLPFSVEHLCLTQAVEAYHGIKFLSHKKHDFKLKVQELAESNKQHLSGLIGNVEEFATTVVENRNHYTHHNPIWKQKGRVVAGSNLHRLNEKLRLIFQMCVLADIGIPAERFVRLRRQLATTIVDYM